jgi:hypothetical protein
MTPGNGHDGTDTHVTYGDPHVVGKGAQFDGTNNNRIDFASRSSSPRALWTIEGMGQSRSVAIRPAGNKRVGVRKQPTAEGIFWKRHQLWYRPERTWRSARADHDVSARPRTLPGNVKVSLGGGLDRHVGGDLLMYLNGAVGQHASGWGVPLTLNCFGYDGVDRELRRNDRSK